MRVKLKLIKKAYAGQILYKSNLGSGCGNDVYIVCNIAQSQLSTGYDAGNADRAGR